MSEISESPIPGIGAGILVPALSHRFRVRFEKFSRPKDEFHALSGQLVSVDYSLTSDTLTLTFDEPAVGGQFLADMARICDVHGNGSHANIYLDDMDGNTGVYKTLAFQVDGKYTKWGCIEDIERIPSISHICQRSYANSGNATVQHVLNIRFNQCTVINIH